MQNTLIALFNIHSTEQQDWNASSTNEESINSIARW